MLFRSPYDAGLPDQRRYGWEGLRRPMEATVETSYRRGEEADPESPSASTLWRRVQERQPALEGSFPEENLPEENRRTGSAGLVLRQSSIFGCRKAIDQVDVLLGAPLVNQSQPAKQAAQKRSRPVETPVILTLLWACEECTRDFPERLGP